MFGRTREAARAIVQLVRETVKVSIRFQMAADEVNKALAEMEKEANAVLVKVMLGDDTVSTIAYLYGKSTLTRKELEMLIHELLNEALAKTISTSLAKMAEDREAQATPTSADG